MSEPELNSAPPSLSDAISRLMANPELLSTVAAAIGGAGGIKKESAEGEEKTAEPQKTDGQTETRTDNERLESAESPAEAVGVQDLGRLIGGLTPMLAKGNIPQISGKSERREADRREALLCALKPYVSEGRREAIDQMIRISQISDMLKGFQH